MSSPVSVPTPPLFLLKIISTHILVHTPQSLFLRLTHSFTTTLDRVSWLPGRRSQGAGNTPNIREHINYSQLNTRALEVSFGADVPVPPDIPPTAHGYHTTAGTQKTGLTCAPCAPAPTRLLSKGPGRGKVAMLPRPHPGVRGGEGRQELMQEMIQC